VQRARCLTHVSAVVCCILCVAAVCLCTEDTGITSCHQIIPYSEEWGLMESKPSDLLKHFMCHQVLLTLTLRLSGPSR
jgi:hypothetical protein